MLRQERSTQYGWRDTRPTWWQLYVIVSLLVTVVWLLDVLVDGEALRTILEVATVAAGFGLVGIWQRRNRVALELEKGRHRV
jgi:hypothetical protein